VTSVGEKFLRMLMGIYACVWWNALGFVALLQRSCRRLFVLSSVFALIVIAKKSCCFMPQPIPVHLNKKHYFCSILCISSLINGF
jgi:hypothetical protein